ncbi:MAG: hypothetical protein JWP79_1887 [Polaromonas sp.]|jgi:hypothetical protein|nr:hypothetical protein [Polaromonas sp.]MDB5844577.1 hypothetical protein [Polaromonas sp.]
MEYGPEHAKVVRQVFGYQVELPVARQVGLHEPRRSLNPEVGKIPLYLNPNYRAKPQWLQNAICKMLDVLTGEAFSGRKR